jgi:hypothetical protein
VEICGILDQIEGRSVIRPHSARILNPATFKPIIKRITCKQVGEEMEGMLVEIENVTVTNWYQKADTAFLASISDGSGTLILQILEPTDIDGHSNPSNTGQILLTGIISQIDEELPYTEGFAIIPRSWIDLSPNTLLNDQEIPGKLHLYQNYPNPFNPETMVSYYLPQPGEISLSIHDILGRIVAIPYQGKQGIGLHTIIWNADRLSSGIYFLKLDTGKESHIKKMILAR